MGYLEDTANVEGKVAVICGGAGGLGEAVARAFGSAGMRLAILDQDPSLVYSLSTELQAAGVDVMARTADARDATEVERFFRDLDGTVDHIDTLVNLVGGSIRRPSFMDTDPVLWEEQLHLNFTHILRVTQLGIERLRRSGRGGSIINVSTCETYRGTPPMAVYTAAKAALTSLTRSLAVEFAPEGIRVNSIAPDIFLTPRVSQLIGEGASSSASADQRFEMSVPMGRVGELKEFAGVALFLASDLSSYVTGVDLLVDGGTRAAAGWFNWGAEEGFNNIVPYSILERINTHGVRPTGED